MVQGWGRPIPFVGERVLLVYDVRLLFVRRDWCAVPVKGRGIVLFFPGGLEVTKKAFDAGRVVLGMLSR